MSCQSVDSTEPGLSPSPGESTIEKSNSDNETAKKKTLLPTPTYSEVSLSSIAIHQTLDIPPPIVTFPPPNISAPPPQVPFFRTPILHTPITVPPPMLPQHTPITIPPPLLPQHTSTIVPPTIYLPPSHFSVIPPPITATHIPFVISSTSTPGANTSMMQSTTTVMTALPPSVIYSDPNSTISEIPLDSPPCTNGDCTPIENASTISAEQETTKETNVNSTGTEKSEPEKTTEIKLPPNWRTAKDVEGNIYYYHAFSRQTQWDPPPFDDELEEEADAPSPPPFDDQEIKPLQRESATTAAPADTSNALEAEIAKKVKERFRLKVSTYVVHCLNPYRKLDCSHGRITTTKDFKHLARKLTHFIMAKEIKQCKNIIEDLEYSIDVKCKTKEFIKAYMSKYGSVYRKEKILEE